MKFTAADRAAMLAVTAAGQTVFIGQIEKTGIFQMPGKAIDLYSGAVISNAPTLLLDEDDAANVTENDTVIEIDYEQYQATQKLPDGTGFVLLELTRDY